MTSIKKQSDGKYYEKIVNWEKKKNHDRISLYFGLIFTGFLFGFLFGLMPYSEAGNPQAVWQIPLVVFFVTIIAFIISFFESHNRKVTFRRIGK